MIVAVRLGITSNATSLFSPKALFCLDEAIEERVDDVKGFEQLALLRT